MHKRYEGTKVVVLWTKVVVLQAILVVVRYDWIGGTRTYISNVSSSQCDNACSLCNIRTSCFFQSTSLRWSVCILQSSSPHAQSTWSA